MKMLHQIANLWYIKIIFGFLLTIISPVQTSIIIILIMIILDTITGIACAIILKRFNSKNFKKSIKKIVIYFTCIFTVRLIEMGTISFMKPFLITQTTIGFLIITEGISILENLSILGLPLPINFLNIFYKQIKIDLLQDYKEQKYKENDELEDMEDILTYQVPVIKSDDLRKELQISVNVWLRITKNIIDYFNDTKNIDKELIYYKIISIINVGIEDIKEDINVNNKNNKKKCSIRQFEKNKLEKLINNIKDICLDITPNYIKKDEIIKVITIFLYQLVLDIQKHEWEICKSDIENN